MKPTSMRISTLETLNLGTVLEIFRRGRLPADTEALVEQVFGPANERGSLVISGANGIVGAGKTMQLGSRLEPYGVRVVALDLPSAPDGIGKHYGGLRRAFGGEGADRIMGNIIRMSYDGRKVPDELKRLRPRFLLEAIPEILEIKKSHYEAFRSVFPEIAIRSVTSGFPSSSLGVGIAHPAFPHEINKVWEVVEPKTSPITQLLWSLGLMPVPVSDDWSFVLDVLFCGITLAGTRFHHQGNMPYWKIDKYIRKLLGPNPFRAHDSIGAKGANFLTWSCLHHLAEKYGEVFRPTPDLVAHKNSGQDWYPPNHFRPMVEWTMDPDEEEEFHAWILGPLFQMTSLLLHEERSHPSHLNIIGELCAQFRRGPLAMVRSQGPEAAAGIVAAYHKRHPKAAETAWFPGAFEKLEAAAWRQLYVNAEHDGSVGAITLGRESYNSDVDGELNRAIDWLRKAGIDRVILSGDFHLTTQLVGADTTEFFAALDAEEEGLRISGDWSRTARRLHEEFKVSVGFVSGKRCLGGLLELLLHCHVLISTQDAALGFPEVTLPVVPGMEGCHWPFRKCPEGDRAQLVRLLLSGEPVRASKAKGWLVDYAGPLEESLAMVWKTVSGLQGGLPPRTFDTRPLQGLSVEIANLPETGHQATETARRAISACILDSCSVSMAEALTRQARHSAGFMRTPECRKGRVGAERNRTQIP